MRKLNAIISEETHERLTKVLARCNEGFEDGRVTIPNIIEWLLTYESIDVQKIRTKCINGDLVLKNGSVETCADIDATIKKLMLVRSALKDREEQG